MGWAVWAFVFLFFLMGEKVTQRQGEKNSNEEATLAGAVQPPGPRRGALETVPCDAFANSLEEDFPVKSATRHTALDLPGWWYVRPMEMNGGRSSRLSAWAGKWQMSFTGANPGNASREEQHGAVSRDPGKGLAGTMHFCWNMLGQTQTEYWIFLGRAPGH